MIFVPSKKSTIILIGVLIFLLFFYLFLAFLLPLPDLFISPKQTATTKIFDRKGKLLYEILDPSEGKKTLVSLDQIPEYIKQATLAAEDISFYSHSGVDFSAVIRAAYQNIKHQRIVSGASTITQQLVRNILNRQSLANGGKGLSRGIVDKLEVMAFAVRLSHFYSKDEVLELYLNKIYYGNLSYGIESAALDYFGKHVGDLDLAESAMLAGLPQSPSNYNPFNNLESAKKRQSYVLDQMAKYRFISEDEANAAKRENLKFRPNRFEIKAPHFVQQVVSELEKKYGKEAVHYGGLNVVTTLDLDMQMLAEEIVDFQLSKLKSKNVSNAALIAVDVKTGHVLTWIGSADYFDESIDGAVDLLTALRQPGSSIKPFTYLAAFEKGWTPATTIADIPTQFTTAAGPYTPKNYDLDFHGLVRARTALASSYNVPAVKTLEYVGVPAFIGFLEKFGIDTLKKNPEFYGLALTLGGGEVRPIDMAAGYLTIANLGGKKPLTRILKVTNAKGELLEEWENKPANNILGPKGKEHIYQLISILSDNNARKPGFGENSVLELNRPAAVKTGTTRNFRDNWTIGFTPQLLTAVWVGNADGSPMTAISGVAGAGPIWSNFMTRALEKAPRLDFKKPNNLREIEICSLSGLLPTKYCKERTYEWFVKGTEPKRKDNIYQNIKIDPIKKQRLTEDCIKRNPSIKVEEHVYEIYPPELKKWALQKGIEQAPRLTCTSGGLEQVGSAAKKNELLRQKLIADDLTVPEIVHPQDEDSFLYDNSIPLENQKIPFHVLVNDDVNEVSWFLNGEKISKRTDFPFSFMWPLKSGNYELVAEDELGRRSDTVKFDVR